MENIIKLPDEDLAILKPFCDHCDARAQGYAEGLEAAKRALIAHFLDKKKTSTERNPDDSSASA